jgi:glycosyltransferase involved in cell wall biosynthesis
MDRPSDLSILFPTGSFYPAQTGGPDNSVYWITKALMDQGVQVSVVSTDRGLPPSIPRNEWLDNDFARIVYTRNWIHYLPLNLIRQAFRKLKSTHVLHLTMIFYPASFLMAILNQLFYKKPVVWSIRGDFDPHMMERSSWKKRPVVFLIRRWLKKKVVFHSTCDAETQYAKANLGKDIEVVQLTNYMELPDQITAQKEKYLLYLGRIDSKKAIENLIEALDESKYFRASGFRLKIAGDHRNPYGKKLMDLVDQLNLKEQVAFVGHISGRAKQKLLAAAYFLIMPSHTENFGIVVAEALAQGTPAVASIHTPWQILEQKGAGFWVDNQIDGLANCLDRILQLSEETYEKIQFRTRPLVEKELDVNANIVKWLAVYEGLLNNNFVLEHEHRI